MPPENDKIWREHLRTILSDPSYHPKASAVSWQTILFNWFNHLLQLLHIKIPKVTLSKDFTWIGVVVLLIIVALITTRLTRGVKISTRRKIETGTAHLATTDYIRLADDHEQAGRVKDAARCLFLAALEHVNQIDPIDISTDRTNGDYLRELIAIKSPFAASFKTVVRYCDALFYQEQVASDTPHMGQHEAVQSLRAALYDILHIGGDHT